MGRWSRTILLLSDCPKLGNLRQRILEHLSHYWQTVSSQRIPNKTSSCLSLWLAKGSRTRLLLSDCSKLGNLRQRILEHLAHYWQTVSSQRIPNKTSSSLSLWLAKGCRTRLLLSHCSRFGNLRQRILEHLAHYWQNVSSQRIPKKTSSLSL